MLRFAVAGRSEVGLVRGNNEDSAFGGASLVLVADGVGGNAGGEIASATSAYCVSREVLARGDQDLPGALADGVLLGRQQIGIGVEIDPTLEGMATTLTAIGTDGTRFFLAHLGDSRAYVVRGEEMVRISQDHTWVQEQIDEGRLSEQAASVHPWRNVVLRSVNAESDDEPDLIELPLRAGDRVLLASDGLTDMVDEARIEQLVVAHQHDSDAVAALVAEALLAGGRDNVTVVLATVVEGPWVQRDGELFGALRDMNNIVDAAATGSAIGSTA